MAILGNDSGVGSDTSSFASGRAWAAKWIAPEDGTITEFHIEYNSGQETLDLAPYGPGSTNQPGARLGSPGTVQTNTTGPVHESITGLAIPFVSGPVWLAAAVQAAFAGNFLETDGAGPSGPWTGIASAKLSGAYPLPDPFPAIDFGPDDRKFRMWVVYTPAPTCNPPENAGGADAPSISGTLGVGETLTADHGTWTGDATITFADQWYRLCGSDPEELIVGATSDTYEQTNDDVGCDLFDRVTASNGCAPDGEADSNILGPVPTPPPTNVTPPTITGVAAVGHQLNGGAGTWDNATSFDEQWYLDCGGGPVAIVGETTDEIDTDESMIGCTLVFGVIAHGPGGASAEAFSAPFGPIVANVPASVRFYQSPPWRFVVLDKTTFETLSFLDHIATDRTATFVLNAPAVAAGKVPSDNPEANIPWPGADDDPFLSEGNRVLLGFRREGGSGSDVRVWVIRFAGVLLQLEDSAESDDSFTGYTAYDPWQLLFKRPVRNGPDLDFTLPGPDGSSYTQTRIDVIVGEILRNTIETDGAVMIDAGPDYGGTAFWEGTIEECDQIDINFSQGTSVGEAWQQLTNMDGCDIILRPIYDPINRPGYLVEMSIYTQAGAVINDAIFAWDKPSRSLVGISRLTDGNERANVIKYFAGVGGTAPGGQTIDPALDAVSIAKFGQYWRQQFWPGQNVAGAVEKLATAQLRLAKDGKTTVEISPAPERSPIPFEEYYLGDRIPVYASSRLRQELVGYQRIYGIPVQIADDQTETILQMLTAVQS